MTLLLALHHKISDAATPDLWPIVPPVLSSPLYHLLYQRRTSTVVVIMHQPLRAVIGYAIAFRWCSAFQCRCSFKSLCGLKRPSNTQEFLRKLIPLKDLGSGGLKVFSTQKRNIHLLMATWGLHFTFLSHWAHSLLMLRTSQISITEPSFAWHLLLHMTLDNPSTHFSLYY